MGGAVGQCGEERARGRGALLDSGGEQAVGHAQPAPPRQLQPQVRVERRLLQDHVTAEHGGGDAIEAQGKGRGADEADGEAGASPHDPVAQAVVLLLRRRRTTQREQRSHRWQARRESGQRGEHRLEDRAAAKPIGEVRRRDARAGGDVQQCGREGRGSTAARPRETAPRAAAPRRESATRIAAAGRSARAATAAGGRRGRPPRPRSRSWYRRRMPLPALMVSRRTVGYATHSAARGGLRAAAHRHPAHPVPRRRPRWQCVWRLQIGHRRSSEALALGLAAAVVAACSSSAATAAVSASQVSQGSLEDLERRLSAAWAALDQALAQGLPRARTISAGLRHSCGDKREQEKVRAAVQQQHLASPCAPKIAASRRPFGRRPASLPRPGLARAPEAVHRLLHPSVLRKKYLITAASSDARAAAAVAVALGVTSSSIEIVETALANQPTWPWDHDHWAAPIVGSAGYGNHRHQADLCHAYQIIKKQGVRPETYNRARGR